MMTYENAIEYLNSTASRGSQPGLSRVTALLGLLGNPQNSVKCVHVTGTNGKGSVSRMTASVLNAEGYKTGLFSSPYLTRVNESIMLGNEEISDDDFAEVMDKVKPLAEGLKNPPTEFEITTAVAFEFFRRKECDVVVLECGMGGATDATNIIKNTKVAVFTSISMDHMDYLGTTLESIAQVKSGIIKDGCAVVSAPCAEEVKKVLDLCASKHNTQVYITENVDNTETLPLRGLYQYENAGLAAEAVRKLAEKDVNLLPQNSDLLEKIIRRGLHNTKWQGRFETISEQPAIIIDGAHNPQAAVKLAESLKYYYPKKRMLFICGMLSNKDHHGVLEVLAPMAEAIFTVSTTGERGYGSVELAKDALEFNCNVTAADGVEEALEVAMLMAKPKDVIVVFGTLTLLKKVKKMLNR